MPCTRPPGRKNDLGFAGIPCLALSVAQVETYRGSRPIELGSGFFYARKDKTYITNRHLLIGECRSQRPDAIKLDLHVDPGNISSRKTVSIDLYDPNGRPVWREHPHWKDVDLVAIPAGRGRLDGCEVVPLSKNRQVPDEIVLDLGQDLVVVGFPEGLRDSVHNLPIALNASLASSHMVPFNGCPLMLVDAKLHPGTSGSPVLTKPVFTARRPDGTFTTSPGGAMYLVDIHSAGARRGTHGEAGEGEPLDLNLCWFASLLDDMT